MILTDPIVAWRLWYTPVIDERFRPILHSPVYGTVWPHGEPLQAECAECKSTPSALGHHCGICGWKSASDIPTTTASASDRFVIAGQVSLWGKVAEHERGWRAEYAYPYGLAVMHSSLTSDEDVLLQVARKLAGAYGVEVTVGRPSVKIA